MERELVMFGNGGMSQEAAAWIGDCGRGDDLLGFLDDDVTKRGSEVVGLTVLGSTARARPGHGLGAAWLERHSGVEAVVAIWTSTAHSAVVDQLEAAGIALATIVHPSAIVGRA